MEVKLIQKDHLYLCKKLKSGELFKDNTASDSVYIRTVTGYVNLKTGSCYKDMADNYYVIKLKQLEPLKVEKA